MREYVRLPRLALLAVIHRQRSSLCSCVLRFREQRRYYPCNPFAAGPGFDSTPPLPPIASAVPCPLRVLCCDHYQRAMTPSPDRRPSWYDAVPARTALPFACSPNAPREPAMHPPHPHPAWPHRRHRPAAPSPCVPVVVYHRRVRWRPARALRTRRVSDLLPYCVHQSLSFTSRAR